LDYKLNVDGIIYYMDNGWKVYYNEFCMNKYKNRYINLFRNVFYFYFWGRFSIDTSEFETNTRNLR